MAASVQLCSILLAVAVDGRGAAVFGLRHAAMNDEKLSKKYNIAE